MRDQPATLRHSTRFWPRPGQRPPAVTSLFVIVLVVLAVFGGIRLDSSAGSPIKRVGVRIVFTASPLDPRSALGGSIRRSVEILRERLDSAFRGVQVSRAGDKIAVYLADAASASRSRVIALAAPGRFAMYDWEANALTPDGSTVASQLHLLTPAALEISQGTGSLAPGDPGAGSSSLYDAVTLASRQPTQTSTDNSRPWPEYYMFGAPGSAACAAGAMRQGKSPTRGVYCLLSGPDSDRQELLGGLPRGVSPSEARQLVVPAGTVVLQAVNPSANHQASFTDPSAQFYVLRDHAALSGSDITGPHPSTDPTGNPSVQFGLTATGKTVFHDATSVLAHRGERISPPGQTLDQHFAIAVDNQLVAVPAIDFEVYPDGVPVDAGAAILGGFTKQSAQDLAILLRFGPLQVRLTTR